MDENTFLIVLTYPVKIGPFLNFVPPANSENHRQQQSLGWLWTIELAVGSFSANYMGENQ
jgi:hypothetical protein